MWLINLGNVMGPQQVWPQNLLCSFSTTTRTPSPERQGYMYKFIVEKEHKRFRNKTMDPVQSHVVDQHWKRHELAAGLATDTWRDGLFFLA